MNEQIAQLQNQIVSLQQEVDNLKRSNAIPREVEKAFRIRLGDIKNSPGTVAVTAIGGAAAFNLPNTTGTLPIIVNGQTYNVLINNPI